MQNVTAKKLRLEKDVAALSTSADFAMQAEDKSDLTLVAKSNSLRKSAKEKTVELSAVVKLLTDKQQELLNM